MGKDQGKLPQGEVRDQIVTAMDWFPTVLDLCGVKQLPDAPKLDGHSMLPIIDSPQAKSGYGGVLHFAWGNKWAVRENEWKLIGVGNQSEPTLHRLTDSDPEVKNHASERSEIVSRLKKLHEKWAAEVTD